MPQELTRATWEKSVTASWVLAGLTLYLVLRLHLLAALFAGLLVHELVHLFANRLRNYAARSHIKLTGLALLAVIVVSLLSALGFALIHLLRSSAQSLPLLAQMMAEIIEGSRDLLPEGLVGYLPADVAEIKLGAAEWLRQHAAELQTAGGTVLRNVAYILVGMIIGAFLSLHEAGRGHARRRPLAGAMIDRSRRLARAFRRVVFAQVRIAALNALLTWIYLGVALPLCGVSLPYMKTLVVVTFVAGLLPVIGNLISNTAIVIVSLSVSLQIALISLIFLIVIHKLEYFVNARIIGSRINACTWEMLIVMLLMEAAFGLAGLIAAPVYYAYLKDELEAQRLI